MAKKTKKSAAQMQKQKQKEMIIVGAVAAAAVLLVIVLAIVMPGTKTSYTSDDQTCTDPNHSHNHVEEEVSHAAGDGATLDTAVATHYVTIEIADYGTIKAELYGKSAPVTVANFVALAEKGFYSGTTFHRIMENFMMQGGAPTESSGTAEAIVGEFTSNGFENNLLHLRGVLSMARTSVPDSASSQFFIVHQDSPHLNGDYAAFGRVTEGLDVVDAVCTGVTPTDGNGSIAEEDQPVITSITVTEA